MNSFAIHPSLQESGRQTDLFDSASIEQMILLLAITNESPNTLQVKPGISKNVTERSPW